MLLVALVVAGYYIFFNAEEYKALTETQKKEFIQTNNLNVGVIEDISSEITVITFEEKQLEGYYSVSSNSKGELSSSYFKMQKNKELPVQIFGVATGAPFIVIKINEKSIQENGRYISINWDNGEVQEENMKNTPELIVPYNKNSRKNDVSYESIQIKDSENNILFDSKQM